MKRYIKSNMLGPAFNLPADNCRYSVAGCIFNEEEAYFEAINGLSTCVADIEDVVDVVLEYLADDRVDTVFVNGQIEFDAGEFWNRTEIISKLVEEL